MTPVKDWLLQECQRQMAHHRRSFLATIDSTDSHNYMRILFGSDPRFEEVSRRIRPRAAQDKTAIEIDVLLSLTCSKVFAVAHQDLCERS
jgi:hypothetical protein